MPGIRKASAGFGILFTLGVGCQAIGGIGDLVIVVEGTPCEGEFVVNSNAWDCIRQICKDGFLVDMPEDDEIPLDGRECTEDRCVAGKPTHFNRTAGSPCGTSSALTCNGTGQCIGCSLAKDCGNDTACRVWQCTLEGICLPDDVPAGTSCEEDGGYGSCDGIGNCRLSTGSVCAIHAQCTTGFCIDGICCDVSCTLSCWACNVSGNFGLCAPMPAYTIHPDCSPGEACDGNGTCKRNTAQSCTDGSQCISNVCSDSMCAPM